MAAKKTMTAVPDADVEEDMELAFEAWSEEDEEAAIQAIVDARRIRYIISEQRFFIARMPDGHTIKTELVLSVDLLEQITSMEESGELEQIKALLRLLGREDELAYLTGLDIFVAMDFAAKYFAVFERIAGMTLGEFAR